MNYLCSKNKGADQLADMAQLICASVFAYAKRFSHDLVHLSVGIQTFSLLDHKKTFFDQEVEILNYNKPIFVK